MKILYLTYDGLTDQLGQSQVIPYLTGLADKGYQITIVSAEKNEKLSMVDEVQRQLEQHRITWKRISYTKHPAVFSTLWDIIVFRKFAVSLFKKNHFDIVHCRSYIASFIGMYLKKKFGVKFIFDMRGFYADERIDGGIWNQKKILYRIIYRYFKKSEKEFLTHADYTICLTKSAKDEIESWQLPKQSPLIIIPCCTDTKLFSKEAADENLQEVKSVLRIPEHSFVLSYLGAIGTWYMLDEMLDFFARLLLKKKDAVFLFITNENPAMIKAQSRKRNIPEEHISIFHASR
jgi:glycosyltransferase involved in cell wall biosynthesis